MSEDGVPPIELVEVDGQQPEVDDSLVEPSASVALNGDVAVVCSDQIADFLDVLERHRIDCERAGKYDEADLAKSRLQQLRQHEEEKRREELRSQQLAERLSVEEAHMKELQDFNESWDQKANEFEAHATSLQGMLEGRHQGDHQDYVHKLQANTEPRNPKWSKELLNMRKIQETLARQKQYQEAGRIQAQADEQEAKEHAGWQARRDAKIAALEEQFVDRQRKEMGGLLKRIQSGREEQKQARKAELERLLQRYHNVKAQLESQQKLIQNKIERYPATPGRSRPGTSTMSVSTMSARPTSKQGAR